MAESSRVNAEGRGHVHPGAHLDSTRAARDWDEERSAGKPTEDVPRSDGGTPFAMFDEQRDSSKIEP